MTALVIREIIAYMSRMYCTAESVRELLWPVQLFLLRSAHGILLAHDVVQVDLVPCHSERENVQVHVPVYWAVSNGYSDGDTLLEQHIVKEKEPAYSPPVAELQDYGSTMPICILTGIVGAIIVLGILPLIGKIVKRNRREDSS
ncbi:MAG: hypothetical protein LUP95_04485 [Euryarchaeota archaeon]|nr:hypothetical protein [Euryarchaeota archaeon]